MTPLQSDTLWHLATARSAEIRAKSPDLGPALELQQRLLRLILDASASLDGTVCLTLTAAAVSDKWRRGVPVMRNETAAIPPLLQDILPKLCTALAEGGAGHSARHIGDAIAGKNIDAASLLSVSLARNQAAIRTSALHMGLSPDLVWLIGELGSSPLAHHLSSSIVERPSSIVDRPSSIVDRPSSIVHRPSSIVDRPSSIGHRPSSPIDDRRSTIDDVWDRGYCPFCGSWPTFIEAIDDARVLRCWYCACGWSLHSRRCIYCGNTGDDFVVAAADMSRPETRVELCGRCSGYTKVIDVSAPTPFPLLAIEDLASTHLDRGAMDRGYGRPELIDLDAIEPRKSAC